MNARALPPAAGTAREFFDAIAGRYERAYALPAAVSRSRMARVIRGLPPAPARVLDLGVGPGRELTALLDAGFAPTGLDVSEAMLERCARRARPVPLVVADFWESLPFEDASFEAAVALHGTLAHPPEPASMARLGADLARVVVSGGVLIAEVPSPAWLERLESATAASMPDRRAYRTGPRTCVYEDLAAGAAIEALFLDEADWHSALGPEWQSRVEAVDELEWLVVARRR